MKVVSRTVPVRSGLRVMARGKKNKKATSARNAAYLNIASPPDYALIWWSGPSLQIQTDPWTVQREDRLQNSSGATCAENNTL